MVQDGDCDRSTEGLSEAEEVEGDGDTGIIYGAFKFACVGTLIDGDNDVEEIIGALKFIGADDGYLEAFSFKDIGTDGSHDGKEVGVLGAGFGRVFA